MQEIAPGIFHWTAEHPRIRQRVSSYYVEPAGVVIDPLEPEEGLGFFRERDLPPQQVVLTNRHHFRHSDHFQREFGTSVRASAPGMHEFEGTGREVEPFEYGDEVAPGVTAIEVGAICPDETALLIEHGGGAVAFADGLIHFGGELGFVPDGLIGDDPPAVKQGLVDSFQGLLERDVEFDTLLFAHGEPLIGGGRSALSDFVNSP